MILCCPISSFIMEYRIVCSNDSVLEQRTTDPHQGAAQSRNYALGTLY
jgi:hypothetical protein